MPTCCTFKDRKTNELLTLVRLDEILCEIQGIKPDDKKMCWLYDSICLIGFAILHMSHGSTITPEAFDAYMAKKTEEEFDEKNRALLKQFLVDDYEFEAWHQMR